MIHLSPSLIIDCQTTSTSSQNGSIIEIAWKTLNTATLVSRSFVLRVPNVHPRILKITGIRTEDLENGHEPSAVMAQLKADLLGIDLCIAHFARFERSFLAPYIDHEKWICTFEILRRLKPQLPCRSLRAAAGYFDFPLGDHKRSMDHVLATEKIWQEISKEWQGSWSDLEAWLQTKVKIQKSKHDMIAAEKRLSLPECPGVYEFLGASGTLLYIGKATCLRDRVNSYFRGHTNKRSKQQEMVTRIKDVVVTPTDTPLEAALVEQRWIKEKSPPYNIALIARGHDPVYLDRHLQLTSTEPYYGPFATARPQAELLFIHEWLSQPSLDEAWILAHSLLPQWPLTLRQLLACGGWDARRSQRRKQLEVTSDPPPGEIEKSDSEVLVAQMRSSLRQLARQLLLGRRLRQVANGCLLVRSDKQWKVFDLRDGELHHRGWKKRAPRTFLREATSFPAVSESTFDQLKIIASEMKHHPQRIRFVPLPNENDRC
jgi:DNA polymerase III epsilon subunit-like protein